MATSSNDQTLSESVESYLTYRNGSEKNPLNRLLSGVIEKFQTLAKLHGDSSTYHELIDYVKGESTSEKEERLMCELIKSVFKLSDDYAHTSPCYAPTSPSYVSTSSSVYSTVSKELSGTVLARPFTKRRKLSIVECMDDNDIRQMKICLDLISDIYDRLDVFYRDFEPEALALLLSG